MHLLLLGYSRIGRRRIIPAVRTAFPQGRISVASRSARPEQRTDDFTWYGDYAEALDRSSADIVYVSLPNSAHAEWIERALAAGLHVVVDKPAVLGADEAARLIDLAHARDRLLAEATVFSYHPQIDTLVRVLADGGTRRRAVAVFSFPSLPPGDFRNRREFGGGAVWDLGPYAVATDRLLFHTPPSRMHAAVSSRAPDGLITGFSVLFSHGDVGSLVGHFGFGTEYQNWLSIIGETMSVSLGRAFTMPADAPGRVQIQAAGTSRIIDVPPADSFGVFLREVCTAIRDRDTQRFAEALGRDATELGRLRAALGES